MKKVLIIDYGLGNLLSIKRAVEYCGGEGIISSDPVDICSASRIVLPGVGAFNTAIELMKKRQIFLPIQKFCKSGNPVLGICLGMQLLFEMGEEHGVSEGLGMLPGSVVKIPNMADGIEGLKIPFVGWAKNKYNETTHCNKNKEILYDGIKDGELFYFTHSYMASPKNKNIITSSYFFGGQEIVASAIQENIIGCQFHPEKSGISGLKLIKNFMSI